LQVFAVVSDRPHRGTTAREVALVKRDVIAREAGILAGIADQAAEAHRVLLLDPNGPDVIHELEGVADQLLAIYTPPGLGLED
jgi:hypothetical protein